MVCKKSIFPRLNSLSLSVERTQFGFCKGTWVLVHKPKSALVCRIVWIAPFYLYKNLVGNEKVFLISVDKYIVRASGVPKFGLKEALCYAEFIG